MGWNPLKGITGREVAQLGSTGRQIGHFPRDIGKEGRKMTGNIHKLEKALKSFQKAIVHHNAGGVEVSEEEAMREIDIIIHENKKVLTDAINVYLFISANLHHLLKEDMKAESTGFSKAESERLQQHLLKEMQKMSVEASEEGNVLLSVANKARRV